MITKSAKPSTIDADPVEAAVRVIPSQPASHYARCCGREIHYVEWGDAAAPVVMLYHGLARNCRDFDVLAAALSASYRVICPDMIGRGLSQWSTEPDREYCLDFYVSVACALVYQLGIERLSWIGTSMGGAIGLRAGATALKDRITHLVLNDVGAAVRGSPGSARIVAYLSNPPAFHSMIEFETYLREIYKPFSRQSDAEWRRMAETSVRRLPNGMYTTHYDPAIARQFEVHPQDYQQWELYDQLKMPVLVLRGETSDLLAPDIAEEMTRRGPRAQLVQISDCGHAPVLNVPEQIDVVRRFLAP